MVAHLSSRARFRTLFHTPKKNERFALAKHMAQTIFRGKTGALDAPAKTLSISNIDKTSTDTKTTTKNKQAVAEQRLSLDPWLWYVHPMQQGMALML